MSEECPFFNGNGILKCNPIQAIPTVKPVIGYDGADLLTVQKDLCKSPDPSREAICPVLRSLRELGLRSQFAKPVISNRPSR